MLMLSPIFDCQSFPSDEQITVCPQEIFLTRKMAETQGHDWPGVYTNIKRGLRGGKTRKTM